MADLIYNELMNSDQQEKEVAIIQELVAVPTQVSATDTSNQDSKVSYDPSGEKHIRSLSENELVQ